MRKGDRSIHQNDRSFFLLTFDVLSIAASLRYSFSIAHMREDDRMFWESDRFSVDLTAMLTEPPPTQSLKFETDRRGLRSNILLGSNTRDKVAGKLEAICRMRFRVNRPNAVRRSIATIDNGIVHVLTATQRLPNGCNELT